MTTRLALLIGVTGVLLVRMFAFISSYAVNVLFSDQWDFYTPLFRHLGVWQSFAWQHGPHRQGVGMLVTTLLAESTGWNARADAFAVGAVLGLITVTAIVLKYRLFRSITYFDLAIPFICLTLFQYEALVVTPNLSHGVLPVLMVLLFAFALLIRALVARIVTLLLLNFLLVYTGFGLFIAPITFGVLLLDAVGSRHDGRRVRVLVLALAVALLSDASFFIGYRLDAGAAAVEFASADISRYPLYVSLMLASFWGWHASILGSLATVAGLTVLVFVVGVCALHVRHLLRDGTSAQPISLVIAVLSTFSLMFCTFTAVGRTPLGLQYAQVSRYLPLSIPLYLAVYFHLQTVRSPMLRRAQLAGYLLIAVVGSLPLGIVEAVALKTAVGKRNWADCYRQLEDAERCNQHSGFQIYPDVGALAGRLEYLKSHRLNLYRDTAVRR